MMLLTTVASFVLSILIFFVLLFFDFQIVSPIASFYAGSYLSRLLKIFWIPLAVPLITFIWGFTFHLIVFVFGGDGNFSDTYKTIVYSSTPAILIGLVPFVDAAAIIWSVVLTIFGISVTHRISKVRAFFILLSIWVLIVVIWIASVLVELYGVEF